MKDGNPAPLAGSYPDVGLVLEGGGFRGIYTAAVLDVMLQEKLYFNYAIGVSAGAAYGVSYVSRQFERNLRVNEYVSDKRYCGLRHLIKTGSYFNWEFVYKEIPRKIVPFDYSAFGSSSTRMYVGVTNCMTGQTEYKALEGVPDRFRDLLTATSSLPFISRMKVMENKYYLDGGLADPIPVEQAFSDGMKRAVVVLTREPGYRKNKPGGIIFMKLFYSRFPELVRIFRLRNERYNQTLAGLKSLEADGKVFIIRPGKPLPVSRLENDPVVLKRTYEAAFSDTLAIIPQLKEWLIKS